MSLLKINEEISNLYDIYNDDECHEKLLEYIQKDLSDKMLSFWERRERNKNLTNLSNLYINDFFVNNEKQYFYISNSEIFISYNGEEFKLVNESEILHEILSGISQNNKVLLPWKHKIKLSIMKKIKEQNMFDIIPDSYTIQFVLNYLTPLLLNTKEEAKYFLSIVGDNMLKKNTDKIHILNNICKDFIVLLEENVFHYFKNLYHSNTTFKYNWHEHDYKKCRIINFNKSVKNSGYWRSFIKYHILDILSVAVHYSKRYGNSDEYLKTKIESHPDLNNIFYLSNNNIDDIITKFVKSHITIVEGSNISMTWKEIYYIWKQFLRENNLPHIIFSKNLKTKLEALITYNDEKQIFLNVTSMHLSFIKNLSRFWRENIEINGESEFEISEISDIFEFWLNKEGLKQNNLSEDNVATLIEHFYGIELEDDKLITNINCKLWDKIAGMKHVIEDIKITFKFSPEMFDKSLQNIYEEYCRRSKTKFDLKIVSKKYFEKYITKIIPSNYIIGKRVSNEFWNLS